MAGSPVVPEVDIRYPRWAAGTGTDAAPVTEASTVDTSTSGSPASGSGTGTPGQRQSSRTPAAATSRASRSAG